jgi:hypothetical protein
MVRPSLAAKLEERRSMTASRILRLFVLTGCLFLTVAARGQDFRVTTKVFDLVSGQSREMTNSLTLFHAGKAYDFINDVGELIIFDPAQKQFTLVSTKQRRATVVHVDEIKRMLQLARQAYADDLDKIKTSDKPGSQTLLEQLVFQIDPKFDDEKLIPEKNGQTRLELKSKHFQYHVECAAAPSPQHVDIYLNYADWICRLNYLLHPGPVLPDQRIWLNTSLRRSQLIPVQVTLEGRVGDPIRLQAQHQIYWDLNDHDRELIRQWDAFLVGREFKRVNFLEYQRALLLSQASRRR